MVRIKAVRFFHQYPLKQLNTCTVFLSNLSLQTLAVVIIHLTYSTIRLRDQPIYAVIVNEGESRINYQRIIESE